MLLLPESYVIKCIVQIGLIALPVPGLRHMGALQLTRTSFPGYLLNGMMVRVFHGAPEGLNRGKSETINLCARRLESAFQVSFISRNKVCLEVFRIEYFLARQKAEKIMEGLRKSP